MERISKDKYYLNIAREVSKRSTCLKRHYWAVIINNDEIIATGYNGSPRGEENCSSKGICYRLNEPHNSGNYNNCNSVHAEMNAIISASRKDMIGSILYLYGEEVKDINDFSKNTKIEKAEPCPICKKLIKNAGIKTIIS